MKFFNRSRIADAVRAAASFLSLDREKITGSVSWHYVDADGRPVPGTGKTHNLVVTTGKNYFARRAINTADAVLGWLAVGTGTTAEAIGQTALVTETGRVAFDSAVSVANNVITCIATVPAGTATGTLQEIGLFNANAAGTMISRALTGALSKPAGMGITFTWTLTLG